jgi:hypothetical protein
LLLTGVNLSIRNRILIPRHIRILKSRINLRHFLQQRVEARG